jgi:eukaryotic-like serine/threonine-protein kinase
MADDRGFSNTDITITSYNNVTPTVTMESSGSADVEIPRAVADSMRYRVLRLHARGGLGEVFLAHEGALDRAVALKEIQRQHADHPLSRARSLMEAKVTAALEHPGVVPIYGIGWHPDGRPYYAMRMIHGRTLSEAITEFYKTDDSGHDNSSEQAMGLRSLLRRFVDVCNVVAYAHSEGVLHRDLKPGNIMVGPFGETLLLDWGIAKRFDMRGEGEAATESSSSVSEIGFETAAGTVVGTLSYMSPANGCPPSNAQDGIHGSGSSSSASDRA